MKKNISNFALILIFILGLSLLLYPTISDYWNSFHQTVAVKTYKEAVADMGEDEYQAMLEKAKSYNEELKKDDDRWSLTTAERKAYEENLDVSGTGVMGYIEIPVIDCELPIYHGVDEDILQTSIGHIEGSSLPIGGKGTHAILSGHRGLPSAKLFTDLDKMVIGDQFFLQILGQTLTYEVYDISIVLPNDLEKLQIEDDKDECTLVTCTPYGVNTHRLLVHGKRVEEDNKEELIRVPSDAVQVDPMTVAPLVSIPLILLLLIVLFA